MHQSKRDGHWPVPFCVMLMSYCPLLGLDGAEREGSCGVARNAGAQNRAWEAGMVRRIRVVLRLKTEAGMLEILDAVTAGKGAIKEIA